MNCCLGLKLTIFEDVLDVLADRPLGLAEELRELAMIEPNGVVPDAYVEPRSAVLDPVEQDLAGRPDVLVIGRPSARFQRSKHSLTGCPPPRALTSQRPARRGSRARRACRQGPDATGDETLLPRRLCV